MKLSDFENEIGELVAQYDEMNAVLEQMKKRDVSKLDPGIYFSIYSSHNWGFFYIVEKW